jgi:hypothetical protein
LIRQRILLEAGLCEYRQYQTDTEQNLHGNISRCKANSSRSGSASRTPPL